MAADISWATWIGAGAAICSTTSFLPQAWKVIRERRTRDLSVGMYSVTLVGFALWTAYGVMLDQWPLIVTNAICLVLSGFILLMTLLPRAEKEKVAETLDPLR
jgi:MtN3 and saliva related transmembrane protein